MEMTPDRWRYTESYLDEVFGPEDEHLRRIVREARAHGLPDIAVSASVGALLRLLTSMTRAETAIELGTLGGYSTLWIARGLAPGGRLITVERDPDTAAFAEAQLAQCKLDVHIEVRRGSALDVLPALARELGPASVDVAFFDAEKTEYPDYWKIVRPMLREGGLLLADNVLGSSSWWIDQTTHPGRIGADRLNRDVSAAPEMSAAAVPLRQGLLIARKSPRA